MKNFKNQTSNQTLTFNPQTLSTMKQFKNQIQLLLVCLCLFASGVLMAQTNPLKDIKDLTGTGPFDPTPPTQASTQPSPEDIRTGLQFFKENVAILDVANRSINNKEFVKEMTFRNYANNEMPATIFWNDHELSDDGSAYDLKANDGIYTTTRAYAHSRNIPFEGTLRAISAIPSPMVFKDFKHKRTVESLGRGLIIEGVPEPNDDGSAGRTIWLECDLKFAVKGCYAQEWGWCDSCCIGVSNCKGGIEF